MPDPIPMGALHPYPTSLPNDFIDRAIALISGAKPDIEDAHRLWHTAGVILSKFDDHAPKGAAAYCTRDEARAVLQAMKSESGGPMKAIDWNKLRPVAVLLLDILRNWLMS